MEDWKYFGMIDSKIWSKICNFTSNRDLKISKTAKNTDEIFSPKISAEFDSNEKQGCFGKIEEDTKELREESLGEEFENNPQHKFFKIQKLNSKGRSLKMRTTIFRNDTNMIKALRYIKRFVKMLFKTMNKHIINKRYANCSSTEIFAAMELALSNIIPEEVLSDDLVNYAIGILKIKKSSELNCKQRIKREISQFNQMIPKFTNNKLKKAMESNSLCILCRCLISRANESISQSLKQALELE